MLDAMHRKTDWPVHSRAFPTESKLHHQENKHEHRLSQRDTLDVLVSMHVLPLRGQEPYGRSRGG